MSRDEFLIVGLGASAGGIQAFKEFFAHVPPDSGMAYVVILHLSPEHESHLAEVLAVVDAMPVTQVTGARPRRAEPRLRHPARPEPDDARRPPGPSPAITRIEERRAPVDIFFRTLAETQRPAPSASCSRAPAPTARWA